MKIQGKEGISVNYCYFLEKAYRCADTHAIDVPLLYLDVSS